MLPRGNPTACARVRGRVGVGVGVVAGAVGGGAATEAAVGGEKPRCLDDNDDD